MTELLFIHIHNYIYNYLVFTLQLSGLTVGEYLLMTDEQKHGVAQATATAAASSITMILENSGIMGN